MRFIKLGDSEAAASTEFGWSIYSELEHRILISSYFQRLKYSDDVNNNLNQTICNEVIKKI